MMKKLLLALGLLLFVNAAQAFTVNNETGQTVTIKVIYSGWWFNHTYKVGGFDNNFMMTEQLDPLKNATYLISTQDGVHRWLVNCGTMARFTVRFEKTYNNVRLYIGSISVL